MRKFSSYGPSVIVLITATLVLFLGPLAVKEIIYRQDQAKIILASERLQQSSVLEELNQAYRDLSAYVEPSVVHISADPLLPNVPLSSGSGWVFDEDGHVVTNYHVVRDAARIEVQLSSGELREAVIVGSDKYTDIAVLQIPSGRLHAAELGNSLDPVRQGDLVFAFGSPFNFRFSVSSGIVSGKGRSVGVIGPTGYENFIQVDAAINPGNSGGPLTDYRGRVIGMNTAIATGRNNSLEEGQFAGIGLAIPLDMIEPVVTQIIEKGTVDKALLGIIPAELNVRLAQELGFVGSGVRVLEVHAGFPAHQAGIRYGDIITAIDDQTIESRDQLRSMISSMRPGDTTKLDIWRPDPEHQTGSTLTINVQLDRLDPLRDRGELPDDQNPERIPQLGILKMQTATPELAKQLGIEYYAGVIVERLVAGSELSDSLSPHSTIVSRSYVVGREERWAPVVDREDLLDQLRRHNLRLGVKVRVIDPHGRTEDVWLRVER